MTTTFSDKPLFTLKQFIGGIAIALTIGGGIARFELKTSNIETKLNTIIAMVEQNKKDTEMRFVKIENSILATNTEVAAITSRITAMLRPDEITIKNKR